MEVSERLNIVAVGLKTYLFKFFIQKMVICL